MGDLRSNSSDRPPPLKSGSEDSWGIGPGPCRHRGRIEALRSDHVLSTNGSGRGRDPVPPQRSGDEERDQWLSLDYRRRRDLLRTPVQPKRPRHAPEPAPPAYGRYGALQDEVPEDNMEWDIEGPDEDPMEDFGVSPAQGSVSQSCRQPEEEDYMEGVRPGVLGGGYVEEPQCSRLDIEGQIDPAAVGTHGGRRWEPRSTSGAAFMVRKAAHAAVWEDRKDIRPPMYHGNPLNLHHFLDKLDDLGTTVTEDMDPP